jgi:hypothetical protein
MYLQKVISSKTLKKTRSFDFVYGILAATDERTGSGSLCSGMDPRIRIRIKMSRIHNTGYINWLLVDLKARNGAGDGSGPFRIIRIHVGLELRLHKPCVVIT